MNNSKVWLFRGLVIAAAALMLWSWFQPWWSISVDQIGPDAAIIHPWGLETHLRASEYALIASAEMPDWFAPFTFTYLGLAVLALAFGLFAPNKTFKFGPVKLGLPSLIIGLAGLSLIGVVVIAFIVASLRAGEYFGGVNIVGYTYIDLGEPYQSGADAGFLPGYWLTGVAGLALVVLAVLRNKIISQPQATAPAPAPLQAKVKSGRA